jgi:hypothetical protein
VAIGGRGPVEADFKLGQVLDDNDLSNLVITVIRWPSDVELGRDLLSGVWADIPALVASRYTQLWSMGMELESRANSFLKNLEELEVSSSFAALLENLGEPSLYKRAGVMRAVINLHPSPPPPPTRISLCLEEY